MSLHKCEHDVPLNIDCELCRYSHVSDGPDHTKIREVFKQDPRAWDVYWQRSKEGLHNWMLVAADQRGKWLKFNQYQIVQRNPRADNPAALDTQGVKPNALGTQIGGDHYKGFKIQPVEFIHANGLGFIEGNIIKYACRWRDKGGKESLEKIKHYVDLLLELEYPTSSEEQK